MITKPKKSLGQNFLSDKNVLESIVLFSGIHAESNVIEIGPGRGALTEVLLATGATVKAIELDRDLVPALQERFRHHSRFFIEEGDILDIPLETFYPNGEPYQVVANIPYYITAPIIRKLLTEQPAPQSITLLVQKEVAERLAGGAKTRSILTVATQFYSKVKLGPVIPKTYFDPVPKVESQLVQLLPYRVETKEDENFFRLVKIGFSARRKTLFNNLVASRLATKENIQQVFTVLQWPLTRRAQDLEIAEWMLLLEKMNGLATEGKK